MRRCWRACPRTPRPGPRARSFARRAGLALAALLLLSARGANPAGATAPPYVLDYQARYNHQSGEPDHLLLALEVANNRAIVGGNRGLALIDLATLPPNGTANYLHRLTGINARDIVPGAPGWYFVNLHRGESGESAGFAVVSLTGNVLQRVTTIEEPGVLYEKLCVRDDLLYVAAHAAGVRVFSVVDPAAPVEIGRLETGVVDAFDVDVRGDTLFVADGAGGLKLVSVADPAQPVLLDGETLETAVGTAEEVSAAADGRVYVAAGGAGLVVYAGGDPSRRTVVPVGGCAESMAWLGAASEFLAVGTLEGVRVLDTRSGGVVEVASEVAARRGSTAALRITSGLGGAGNRLLCANWNYVDVYRLRLAAQSTEADITPEVQRIRFAPEGGTATVALRNDGAVALDIQSVSPLASGFSTGYEGGVLQPGEAANFEVTYSGTMENAAATLTLGSNDPDESVCPIQLFGRTTFPDPGEEAPDFTLPLLRYDHAAGEFSEKPFTLSDHRGRIVWFQVYASW